MLPFMEVNDLEAVVGALNRADVAYVVVGGLAVIAHGYLRTTADLDDLAQLARLRALEPS